MTLDGITVKDFIVFRGRNSVSLGPAAVFCSGENGAGKTTFFVDSILYAFYGPSAVRYRGDRVHLISPGARDLSVEVRFTHAGKSYRIVRGHSKDRSWAQLDEVTGEGLRRVATGANDVTAKIKEIFNMDHRIFLSTVVVRQGEIESIIDATPSEVRDIFLKLFNIDFTAVREEVKRRIERLELEKARLEEQISMYSGWLRGFDEEEAEKEYGMLKMRKKRLENEYNALVKNREVLDSNSKNLRSQVAELERKAGEYRSMRSRLARLEEERRRHTRLIQELEHVAEKLRDIERRLEEAVRRESCLREVYRMYRVKLSPLKERIRILEERVRELWERSKVRERLARELEKLDAQIARLGDIDEEYNMVNRKIMELYRERGGLASALNLYQDKLKELDGFIASLSGGEVSRCPLCGSTLSAGRAKSLLRKYEEERDRVKGELSATRDRLAQVERELKELGDRLREIELRRRRRDELLQLRSRLKRDIEEAEEAGKQYREAIAEKRGLEAELAKLEAEYSAKAGKCGFKVVFDESDRVLDELGARVRELMDERSRARSEVYKLDTYRRRLEELVREAAEIERRVAEFGEVEARLEEARRKLRDIEARLEEVIRSEKSVYGELKEVEKEIKHLGETLEEMREIRKRLLRSTKRVKEISEDLDVYRYLDEQVFADSKLPLVLLRHYVDRVSAYTQEYVDRLLGGRFVVNMLATKSGVEIRIGSRGVTRSPKSLSMGERIALGFAIRLGIISALAEARGVARPDFLIIDEGLSGLDEERREAFLTALNELRKDFATLVVISHIPDIAESPLFDVHVRVVRRDDGSRVIMPSQQ